MWRMTVTFAALIAITWYLMTTDEEGEESHMDLLMDFTKLMIIIEIDHMVQPLRNIRIDELNVHRNESLRRRVLRYSQLQKRVRDYDLLFKAFN